MPSNSTYVRWQREEPRRQRSFNALDKTHPAYLAPCVLCISRLGDDVGGTPGVTLLAVGPDAEDTEAIEQHESGHWYTASAVLVHTTCLDKLADADLEKVLSELVKPPAPEPEANTRWANEAEADT